MTQNKRDRPMNDRCKKLQVLSSITKGRKTKQLRKRTATGGGPKLVEHFTPLEKRVLEIIGATSVEVLPTGLD